MGIGVCLFRIDEATRRHLLADSRVYFALCGGKPPSPPESLWRQSRRRLESWGWLRAAAPVPPTRPEPPPVAPLADADICDLDKAWNAIHFLLRDHPNITLRP